MGVSGASLARKAAMYATKAAIEDLDDAKVISRAQHRAHRNQLRLRDAEKAHAAKIQSVANTVNTAMAAVEVAKAAKGVGEEGAKLAAKADQKGNQGDQKAKKAEQDPKKAKLEKKKAEKEKQKQHVRDALQKLVKDQVVDGLKEKLEHAQKRANERAEHHEEIGAKFKDVGQQIYDDALAHHAEVLELDRENYLNDVDKK